MSHFKKRRLKTCPFDSHLTSQWYRSVSGLSLSHRAAKHCKCSAFFLMKFTVFTATERTLCSSDDICLVARFCLLVHFASLALSRICFTTLRWIPFIDAASSRHTLTQFFQSMPLKVKWLSRQRIILSAVVLVESSLQKSRSS